MKQPYYAILLIVAFFLLNINGVSGQPQKMPSNLLTNPGAESGVSPCYTFAGVTAIQQSSNYSRSGNFSFLSTNRTQSYHGPAFDLKSYVTGGQLVNGQRYTFSVWVRHHEATNTKLRVDLKKVDGNGSQYPVVVDEDVPPGIWTYLEGHFVFTYSGTLTSLEMYVRSQSGTFDFYSDDFFVGETENYNPPASSSPTDFIRASGKNIVYGAGSTPVVFNGINVTIPTDASDTPDQIWATKTISEKDFQNIAGMGFNAIRLLMNYVIFEDDASPGIFKNDGWHWLDRAIMLAKNAGLYLMLDMHVPQGGYQSDKTPGFSAFWDESGAAPNTDNQDRLIALWAAIADRYKHEPAILGFDLINEPRPNNSEEWFDYAEQLISAIRANNTNHMMVVEVPFIPNYTVRTVNDNNVMYDSHFYYTWGYATQFSAAYENSGQQWGKYDPANPVYVNSSGDVVASTTPGAVPFDQSYLESMLLGDILDFADEANVPVNVGEYGIVWEAFGEDVGAMQYMRDLWKIFDGMNANSMQVSRFYFSYQGNSFGLYNNWIGFQPQEINLTQNLKHFFANDFVWTGQNGTFWTDAGNWITELSPMDDNNVKISSASNQPFIENDFAAPAICNNLEVETGALLTINPAKAMTIEGAFVNDGEILLKSDATGTASLIHHTAGVEVKAERYIAGYTSPIHGWHLISSPVAGQPISVFHDPASNDDFYKWNEPTGEWINRKTENGELNPQFEINFGSGTGYLIAKENTETHQFQGEMHVSDINVSTLTNTPGSYSRGWHLLGNPFGSAITWNNPGGDWNLSNVAANCQVWNESTASYEIVASGMAIPSANGFMVYTTGNGSLTIPASSRVHADKSWYKNEIEGIVLMASDVENISSQKTIIRFNSKATEAFDVDYDSYFIPGHAPLFYSIAQDKHYALNTLPHEENFNEIPLGFMKNQQENFIIKLSSFNIQKELFLLDKKMNVTHNLSQSPYSFVARAGDDPDRFVLKIQATGIESEPLIRNYRINLNGNQMEISGLEINSTIYIFNTGGQVVAQYENHFQETLHFSTGLPAGIYILFLQNKNGVSGQKFAILN